jgi:integrase
VAVLFEDAAREFLAHHRIYTDGPDTIEYKFRVLRRHFDGHPLQEIDAHAIEVFMGARLEAGIARATLNRLRAALSVFFTWAIACGYATGPNPVRAVRKFRESAGRTRYLSAQEADRLLLAAAPHLKPIVLTALHTGGRLSEILALRWADIDLDAGVVTFRRETTKSRRTRSVPMSADLRLGLAGLRRGRPDQHVFVWNEAPLRSVRTAFAHACRQAHIEGVTFHTLRHTFSSWATMAGLDLRRLQKYLGHSTIALTERYSHLSPEYLKDGARFFGPPRATKPTRADDGDA